MKTKLFQLESLLSFLFFLVSGILVNAQTNDHLHGKYTAAIYLSSPPYEMRTEIFCTGDSSISFRKKRNDQLLTIPVNIIQTVSVRKKGNVGGGILIGGLCGTFAGGLLGYTLAGSGSQPVNSGGMNALGDELSKTISTGIGAMIGLITGSIIGGAIGSSWITIPLDKNQDQYQKYRRELAGYSITKK